MALPLIYFLKDYYCLLMMLYMIPITYIFLKITIL